jgi:hypothetical protein
LDELGRFIGEKTVFTKKYPLLFLLPTKNSANFDAPPLFLEFELELNELV